MKEPRLKLDFEVLPFWNLYLDAFTVGLEQLFFLNVIERIWVFSALTTADQDHNLTRLFT